SKWKINEILKWTRGELLIGNSNSSIKRVSKDSRDCDGSTLFFFLIGENTDGHNFINEVIANGCENLVISDISFLKGINTERITVILVNDTTVALQEFATNYLNTLNAKKIAITGSTGKTTTKEMIFQIASSKYKTAKNQGNYNNHIGMPLSILAAAANTEVLVLEMGMDKFGEIDFLGKMLRPDIAVITNIGVSHIENLGTREGIFKAKMEIAKHLDKNATLAFTTGKDFLKKENIKGMFNIISAGESSEDDLTISTIELLSDSCNFTISSDKEMAKVSLPLPGFHNVTNAALAMGVAKQLNISLRDSAKALEKIHLEDYRQRQIKTERILIIDDCYNASPDSMKAAIDVLNRQKNRKVAILGDMLELGNSSPNFHREVGEYVLDNGVDLLIAIGEMGAFIAEAAKRKKKIEVRYYQNVENLIKDYDILLNEKDVILVKASRGMAFEKVVNSLIEWSKK
ncbi:MAG: UDP-N-acetylmuramoyl-tripeptide--D-alanyl-D-alanine ligase, partial [Anaerovoracaceae bacterium]